ncbi:MAG: hypothetical protein ACLGHX_09420 [Acidimicrobiia bacterium]
MAWFWTDDLARILLTEGVPPRPLAELLSRPVAVAASDQDRALDIVCGMAGVERRETDAA